MPQAGYDILQGEIWSGLCKWGGGGIYKKDSLSNKFSISKSDSSSTVTLKGQNLQTEDTAVYYCARRPQHEKTAQALYMNYYSKHPLRLQKLIKKKS